MKRPMQPRPSLGLLRARLPTPLDDDRGNLSQPPDDGLSHPSDEGPSVYDLKDELFPGLERERRHDDFNLPPLEYRHPRVARLLRSPQAGPGGEMELGLSAARPAPPSQSQQGPADLMQMLRQLGIDPNAPPQDVIDQLWQKAPTDNVGELIESLPHEQLGTLPPWRKPGR